VCILAEVVHYVVVYCLFGGSSNSAHLCWVLCARSNPKVGDGTASIQVEGSLVVGYGSSKLVLVKAWREHMQAMGATVRVSLSLWAMKVYILVRD
jgi:hypothetical protein